jgi:Domain of unknown function (DUF4160)
MRVTGHYPGRVPQITEPINGIEIFMYVAPREHPPPHFHAIDGGAEAQISIDTLTMIGGSLRSRRYKLVKDWAEDVRHEVACCE